MKDIINMMLMLHLLYTFLYNSLTNKKFNEFDVDWSAGYIQKLLDRYVTAYQYSSDIGGAEIARGQCKEWLIVNEKYACTCSEWYNETIVDFNLGNSNFLEPIDRNVALNI